MSGTRRAQALAAFLLLLAVSTGAQQAPRLGRSIYGTVLNALNQPLASAIVVLKNMKSNVIHNVITDANGAYAFHNLQAGVSYEVYAQWQGHRSKTRTDSQYNPDPTVRLDLTIPIS